MLTFGTGTGQVNPSSGKVPATLNGSVDLTGVIPAPVLANAPTGSGSGNLSTNQGAALDRLFAMTNSSNQFLAGAFALFPNVTVGGYATGRTRRHWSLPNPLKAEQQPITFIDLCRIMGAYIGGNTDGTSLYKALGDPTKTRITYSVNGTTKARTITIKLSP